MSPEVQSEAVRHHCVLYVNDVPDEHVGNGRLAYFQPADVPHGHVYFAEKGRHVVQVSFVAHNGRATRVSFDPETGEATVQDITKTLPSSKSEASGDVK